MRILEPSCSQTILNDWRLLSLMKGPEVPSGNNDSIVISSGIFVIAAWNFSRCFHSERDQAAGNHRTGRESRETVQSPLLYAFRQLWLGVSLTLAV
ncbi:hypothetical protein RclHR1_37730002 [Rhizophagus clarus]|uniref:Uncharacterized protein n=1 Tax=Rhizophagus clarus TaxID=94130 RepID=A0A2Z6S7H8_9GLOM|nr:hypothetical protein RclHR1_37730002 [Rhizophagus clarus]GET01958.1 hypothetical protein RCL_e16516_RclHR1_37730002 [Rhizophagus clarus]